MKNCTLLGRKSECTKHVTFGPLLWKLRCRKSARRCGVKHISKSKCTKHIRVGPLLEVATGVAPLVFLSPPSPVPAGWWRFGRKANWLVGLCLKCHKKKWPEAGSGWVGRVGWVGEVGPGLSIPRHRQDGRKRNRWCIPKVVPAGGVHRHYVIEPPPDGTGSCGRYLLSFVIVFPPVLVGPLPPPPSRPRGPQRHAPGKGLLLSKKPPLSFPTQP